MEKKLEIKKTTIDDVYELSKNLRKEDIEETNAVGHTPLQALLEGYTSSYCCFSAKYNNETMGIFGVINKGTFGIIWFLGSDESMKHPIYFTKKGKQFIRLCLKRFQTVGNCVYSENVKHIEWLKAIGCKIDYTTPIFINNNKFYFFFK